MAIQMKLWSLRMCLVML